jgi:hypothetical protein
MEEEDNVSDESGYAELMDVGVKDLRKEKDQLAKTVISSQCLQV